MEALREYLNSMSPEKQEAFAEQCDTSISYLRKAISVGHKMGERLVISIEKASHGSVRCEDLRPDVDWSYLRGTRRSPRAVA